MTSFYTSFLVYKMINYVIITIYDIYGANTDASKYLQNAILITLSKHENMIILYAQNAILISFTQHVNKI